MKPSSSQWSKRRKRVKPGIGTGAVRAVGSSPHKGNAEVLKTEKLKPGPGIEAVLRSRERRITLRS